MLYLSRTRRKIDIEKITTHLYLPLQTSMDK